MKKAPTKNTTKVSKKKLEHDLVGTGRSLAEEIVIALLRINFPGIKIERNDKSVLGRQEIDIHLCQYKIAIEIDGISHHKNVWGEERLLETQARDKKKNERLAQLGYILYRINISETSKESMYSFLKNYTNTKLIPELKEVIPTRVLS